MIVQLHQGDALEVLKGLPDNSADSLVCDPPAGIGFMEAEWDQDKGGRLAWIAWLAEVMREAMRVLKPGAHGLVWALPRTSHWTATALEEAGFEIRDVIMHLFGTGFPKNMDVSKAIDKRLGASRPVVAEVPQGGAKFKLAADAIDNGGFNDPSRTSYAVTAPGSPEAEAWEGWGTALKPAAEHWILVRKPFKGAVVDNVLKHGTGAINIGALRVGSEVMPAVEAGQAQIGTFEREGMVTPERVGRWPAHLLLTHSPLCADDACAYSCPVRELDGQSGVSKSPSGRSTRKPAMAGSKVYGSFYHGDPRENGYGDAGGASRFFTVFEPELDQVAPFIYAAKPSVRERELGLDTFTPSTVNDGRETPIDNPYQRGETKRKNTHPTVKSKALMTWLIKLITPPGGVVLDCFMGSGSTGLAAVSEGFGFIGVELSPDFHAIAAARVAAALKGAGA